MARKKQQKKSAKPAPKAEPVASKESTGVEESNNGVNNSTVDQQPAVNTNDNTTEISDLTQANTNEEPLNEEGSENSHETEPSSPVTAQITEDITAQLNELDIQPKEQTSDSTSEKSGLNTAEPESKVDGDVEKDESVKETATEPPATLSNQQDTNEDVADSNTDGDTLLAKYRQIIESLRQEITDLRDQTETLESERDDIQEEYDNLVENVGLVKQKLHERYKDLESKAQQSSAAAAESAQQVVKLTSKTSDLEAENAKLRADAADFDLSVSKYKDEANQCRQQMASQKIMFDQESANFKLTKDGLELELAQVTNKLEDSEEAKSTLENDLNAEKSRANELEMTLAQTKADSHAQTLANETKVSELEQQNEKLLKELNDAKAQVSNLAQSSLESTNLETTLRKEIKDQQLLIGKLRHEAVILNEHLTHALKIVRNNSEGQSVDKELVSNLFLQYATCARQDTKKYEILQLIANFLDWNEEYRQLSGLNRPNPISEEEVVQNTQMVGVVGKLAEFLESRIKK